MGHTPFGYRRDRVQDAIGYYAGYREAIVPAQSDAIRFSGWSEPDDTEIWQGLWVGGTMPLSPPLT
jgi:hypothetical protein